MQYQGRLRGAARSEKRYVGLMLRNVLNKLSQAALVVGLLLVAWDYLLKPPDSIFKQIPSPDHKYIA